MANERSHYNYNTSTDYAKLFELIKTQRVICIVKYKKNIGDKEVELEDVCSTSIKHNDTLITIGVRGTCYISAMEFEGKTLFEDFIEQCRYYSLSYITPDSKE